MILWVNLRSKGQTRKNQIKRWKIKKILLDKLRQTLGFSDDTEFLGYAIYLEGSGEFLAELTDMPKAGVIKKVWTRNPQSADRYKTLAKAVEISKECPHSVIIGLFDTGTQIMTVTMSANR